MRIAGLTGDSLFLRSTQQSTPGQPGQPGQPTPTKEVDFAAGGMAAFAASVGAKTVTSKGKP